MLLTLLPRGWADVAEIIFVVLVFGAIPAAIAFGLLLRRTADRRVQYGIWSAWIVWTFGIWVVCLPQTVRTNEPSGEWLVLVFFLKWGPLIAVAWLARQHWFGTRERAARGFPIEPSMHKR